MDAEPLEIDADPTGTTDYLHQAALSSFAPMATAVNLNATTGEFAPVYAVMGMVTVAFALGLHTVKQQLVHYSGVNVRMKRRESIPEVDDPDVVANPDKFVNKSFPGNVAPLRKTEVPCLILPLQPFHQALRSRDSKKLQG